LALERALDAAFGIPKDANTWTLWLGFTCTLGHAHPALVETVSRQIQTLHHVSNLFYIPVQGQLAKWLIEHSCAAGILLQLRAEANEGAIKLARKYAHKVLQIEQPVI